MITEVNNQEVVLNVGRDVGAIEGMKLRVLPEPQDGGRQKAYVGILSLVRVMADSCLARVDQKYDTIVKGQRVVEFREKDADEDRSEGQGA